ncbi:putative DNA-binding transcriptional regulator, XRE-family HTH domain [Hyphomicrobiales bacterium]|jgi:transcriptional regulator with XRE-family HTH domain|nr:putative DNA-binding transcriptional regulator, XRE-family HTH domain [Hyphomicrobiales bacterium]CAH1696937.1 putative DNA-binding transcriptional regulator, XRE-family HTH domain [Hyphomicrobiales bacterium]
MEFDREHIAWACRTLREMKGWTQQSLSEESGVSQRAIEKIEGAHVTPQMQTLLSLARAFDVDMKAFRKAPQEEIDRFTAEVQQKLERTVKVPLRRIQSASDFMSLGHSWDGAMTDMASINDAALTRCAELVDVFQQLDGIWPDWGEAERARYSLELAATIHELETLGVAFLVGEFRRQHESRSGSAECIAFLMFTPLERAKHLEIGLVVIDPPWRPVTSYMATTAPAG